MSELRRRTIEMSLAYQQAMGIIETECCAMPAGELENGWYDLASSSQVLDVEIEYLDSRFLLERHPVHSLWVIIRDEDKPLSAVRP